MIGRLLVQKSQQSLSLRQQVYHPWTRTYVRLLGPCFKTGRKEPFSHRLCVREAPSHQSAGREEQAPTPKHVQATRSAATRHEVISPQMSSTRHIHPPEDRLPCPKSFPRSRTGVDTQGKNHHTRMRMTISPSNTGSIRFPFSNFRHF